MFLQTVWQGKFSYYHIEITKKKSCCSQFLAVDTDCYTHAYRTKTILQKNYEGQIMRFLK